MITRITKVMIRHIVHRNREVAPISYPAELSRVLKRDGHLLISVFHPANAIIGGGAFFSAGDGRRGIVKNSWHGFAGYVTAFVSAGLEIEACIERVWTEREVFDDEHRESCAGGVHRGICRCSVSIGLEPAPQVTSGQRQGKEVEGFQWHMSSNEEREQRPGVLRDSAAHLIQRR